MEEEKNTISKTDTEEKISKACNGMIDDFNTVFGALLLLFLIGGAIYLCCLYFF